MLWKISAFIVATLAANTALAQQLCVDRDQMVRGLTNKYGESQQAVGMVPSTGDVIEVWANHEKKNFHCIRHIA